MPLPFLATLPPAYRPGLEVRERAQPKFFGFDAGGVTVDRMIGVYTDGDHRPSGSDAPAERPVRRGVGPRYPRSGSSGDQLMSPTTSAASPYAFTQS